MNKEHNPSSMRVNIPELDSFMEDLGLQPLEHAVADDDQTVVWDADVFSQAVAEFKPELLKIQEWVAVGKISEEQGRLKKQELARQAFERYRVLKGEV